MYVYKITNKANGMCYVGQTIKDPKIRFKEHCARTSGCWALRDAIFKYGQENFILSILAEARDSDELNNLEVKFIKKNNCVHPKGYNLTNGRSGVAKLVIHIELPSQEQVDKERNKLKRMMYASLDNLSIYDLHELWTDAYIKSNKEREKNRLSDYEIKALELIAGLHSELRTRKITKTVFRRECGYILNEIGMNFKQLMTKAQADRVNLKSPQLCPHKVKGLGILCALYDEGYPVSIISKLLSRSYVFLPGGHAQWNNNAVTQTLVKYYDSRHLVLDPDIDYYLVFRDYLDQRKLKFKIIRA